MIAVYVMSTCKSVEQDEDEDFIKFRPTFDKTNEKLKVGLLPILTLFNILNYQTVKTCWSLNFFFSILRGHSVFSSPPQRQMTADFEGFSIPDFIHYIYFPILILEKEPVLSHFNVQC